MHINAPYFMLVLFIVAPHWGGSYDAESSCWGACISPHLPLVVLQSALVFCQSPLGPGWMLHGFYARDLLLLRVTCCYVGIPFIVFMYIVNDLLLKSKRLMVFDHTGVGVTSTPDCVFDPWHMKTVTVGLWFFFLRPSSYRRIQLLDHSCFDLCCFMYPVIQLDRPCLAPCQCFC